MPIYRALRTRGPVVVDGRLDEPSWRTAPEAILLDSATGGRPSRRTTARILWDRESLYVGFTSRDGEAWSRPGGEDGGAISDQEVVEVLVEPGDAEQGCLEIGVSPANGRLETRLLGRSGAEAVKWRSGARTAVRVDLGPAGDRTWTAEMAIPLDALRGRSPPPRPGDRWRLNLLRLEIRDGGGPKEGSAFSPPLRGDPRALDRFGWLVFD